MGIIRNNPNFRSVDEVSIQAGTAFDAIGGTQEYERRFRVVVKRKDVGPLMCCKAPGLPLAFAPYQGAHPNEFDLRARAIRFRCEPETADDWQCKIVTVSYSTKMPDGGVPDYAGPDGMPIGADDRNNPRNRPELQPPDIEWDFAEENEVPQADLDGALYANSARQPFRNPPAFPVGYPVLVISRNEIAFNIDTAQSYAYSVNSDRFLGRRRRHCLMLPPKAKEMFDGPYVYWRVTYRIKLWKLIPIARRWRVVRAFAELGKPFEEPQLKQIDRGFQPRLLDQGLCELVTVPDSVPPVKVPVPIMRNDSPITQEELLNGKGEVLVPDGLGKKEPVWIDFTQYPERPFKKVLDRGFGGRI